MLPNNIESFPLKMLCFQTSESIYFSYKLNTAVKFPIKSVQKWNFQVLQIFTIISPKH